MQKKLKIVLTSLNKSKKSAHCLRCAGHVPVGLSKRGRDTESDANIRQKEMLSFFHKKYSICIPSEIEGHDSLVLFLLMPNGTVCLKRQSRFLCNGQKKPVYLPDICSSCFMIIFLTISPPMLPACAEVKSPL